MKYNKSLYILAMNNLVFCVIKFLEAMRLHAIPVALIKVLRLVIMVHPRGGTNGGQRRGLVCVWV